ncbi:MAG: FAD-binding protein [Phycisphaerales bacterium]|nr:FAD-binding protein [Phycisphaerales bacterium]
MSSFRVQLPVLGAGAAGGVDRARLAAELRRRIDGEVRFGALDRLLYATDASIYQVEPIGVVVPRTTGDAVEALRFCHERGLPVLPRGGGTALAGQTVNLAMVIDFSQHCRAILEADAAERRARVEPGVVLDQLNAAIAPHDLMFGPDVATSSHATIGGMIGNNSAGAWSILYGRTVEHLLGIEVAMHDGERLAFEAGAAERDPRVHAITVKVAEVVRPLAAEIRARYPRIRRHVDGYNLDLLLDQLERSSPGTFDQVNLAHLVCGSEGTLCTTLSATLGLVPRPRARGLAILSFGSVRDALASLRTILDTRPAAVELVDDVVISTALANNEYRAYVELMPRPAHGPLGAVLYVEYFGDAPDAVAERFEALRRAVPEASIAIHTEPGAMARAWRLRKAGEPLLHGIPGLRKPITFVEDTAVDPLRLPEFVEAFRAIVARHGTTAAYYAHASVGCLHIRPLVHLRDPEDLARMEAIAADVTDLVSSFDGALSGEHGDGRVRSPFLRRYFGDGLCDGFARIKAVFDPQGRMNPGNIVAPESMTAHLRVRPEERWADVPDVRTYYRYEREHGFRGAVEMCNGAGICRRTAPANTAGTMCPSYRALLDEQHATRGRGNALRVAITGQLRADRAPAWSDPDTLETLRLCLSCKACKTECPSNVDIAKLKAEFLAQRYDAEGRVPFAARVFGRVRDLNRAGSALHPVANALSTLAPARWLASAFANIDRRRTIPRFGPSLHGWMARRRSAPADAPAVVLFPDCFTVYNDPHIGRSAVEMLEAFGYRVVLPPPSSGVGCCGRSLISVGMLKEATGVVRATAEALRTIVARERAVAVVACEPSCLSAIKDDWLELELGADPEPLRQLASVSRMVEEFLHREWDSHPRRPSFKAEGDEPLLLHGHCHQKALWGVETSAAMLRRVFGPRLRTLESGCCGMAGSFGYTRDRYELSMRIGELSVFPPVRSAPDSATIVAPGTSCRHQVHDGTGRPAVHPVEVLRSALCEQAS